MANTVSVAVNRESTLRKRSTWRRTLARLLRVRLAGAGLLVTIAIVMVALLADVVSTYDPNLQDYAAVLQPPSAQHWMGTDNLGRDVLSRIIYGSRVSLEVGLISVGLAALAGTSLGLAAGYRTGATDELVMRLMDAIYAFPALLLALAIRASLGPSIGFTMVAIGFVRIPVFARLARGQVLSVRELPYVMAARAVGARDMRIITRHVAPNILTPIIVQASLSVPAAIIVESSLSFLGLGVPPPDPTWGSMLRTGYQYASIAPWVSLFSGAAIFTTVLGLNLLGDGLRIVLDPKLARRDS